MVPHVLLLVNMWYFFGGEIMKIFLISGKARSGKETTAKIIQDYFKDFKTVVITEYSKYIKLYAKELLGWDGTDQSKPRKFLQDVGYLIRHKLFSEDFFVKRMKEDIEIYKLYADILIIADVRYPNEIIDIKSSYDDVVSINIINGYNENKQSRTISSHESELALDNFLDFDYVVKNIDKEELKKEIINIMEEVK